MRRSPYIPARFWGSPGRAARARALWAWRSWACTGSAKHLSPATCASTAASCWICRNGTGGPFAASKPRLRALLESVCLPPDEKFPGLYPRQLSVGLAQRVLIAMALIHHPALIVADEPTSALDMITQAEILELFRRVNREHGADLLYISHDLASRASLAHRIAVLERGSIVEEGPPEQVFRAPRHPYTARRVAALPRLGAAPPGETEVSAAGLCALEF